MHQRYGRVLPEDPDGLMCRTLSVQVHGALDPLAAFVKQVLPAQDVHPRVQDRVKGCKSDSEKIAAVIWLHACGDVRRAVELIDKDANLLRTQHGKKKKKTCSINKSFQKMVSFAAFSKIRIS